MKRLELWAARRWIVRDYRRRRLLDAPAWYRARRIRAAFRNSEHVIVIPAEQYARLTSEDD